MQLQNKKVAIDTNMLTAMLEFKIDIFEETKKMFGNVDFVILKKTISELEKITQRYGKEKKKAEFALKVLEKKNWRLIEVEAKNCDDALVKISNDYIIATNDKKLKKRIKENKGKVLFIKQKKFIGFDG